MITKKKSQITTDQEDIAILQSLDVSEVLRQPRLCGRGPESDYLADQDQRIDGPKGHR